MKKIPLTRGKFAIVNDLDFIWLSKVKWYFSTVGYAVNSDGKYMHRLIVNPGKFLEVDHINHNCLDNRRKNLRACTKAENGRNRPSNKKNSTKYKGVSMHSRGSYIVQITVDNKSRYLGLFRTPQEGARAYNKAAKKYHGKYAFLNKI